MTETKIRLLIEKIGSVYSVTSHAYNSLSNKLGDKGMSILIVAETLASTKDHP